MFLGILTLITALSISAVAIYYSVAGLVAIFAAAAIPIIIMGGVLEVGKLVTAVWLHKYWKQATWWLKTYLSAAVIILMFITSMGIFGFLSKAHIEQTAAAGEGVAQIEQIEKEIARQQAVIARAEQIVETTQTSGTGADQNIQAQIDREQSRIDTAYDRVQPAIDATRSQLESDKKFYLDQLPVIDEKLTQFEVASNIDTTDEEAVKRLQALVGSRPDGAYGGGTARAVKAYKEALEQERTDILNKVEELKANSQEEIARLRSRAEAEIDDSNTLINRLRGQLGQSTGEDIDVIIDEQNARINAANLELDTLTEEKFTLEAEYRKLEAEVGPIKYIAEFIYGETADNNLLEEAVRWVIIVIIFVFDPLAVLLLIASQYTFEWRRKDDDGERLRQEYEQARAQRIVDNPGVTFDDPVPTNTGSALDDSGEEEVDVATEEEGTGDTTETGDGNEPTTGEDPGDTQSVPVEQEEDTQGLSPEEVAEPYIEKKSLELLDEYDTDLARQRTVELDNLEQLPEWGEAKRLWKIQHPDLNLKQFKNDYIIGRIDQLPWHSIAEDLTIENAEKRNYVIKDENGNQIHKETYVQNSEQSDDSIWQRIKRDSDN